jgi:PqqD family protein of HPr-rel-A system
MHKQVSVKPALLRNILDDQVLIFDPEKGETHLLDPITGAIFNMIAEQTFVAEGVGERLVDRFGTDVHPESVTLALAHLVDAGLILVTESQLEASKSVNRRAVIAHLAQAGVAAALIPAIVTLGASTAYAQASQTNLPNGASCTQDSQCASGICNGAPQYNNTCQPCQPTGNTQGVCTRNLECCVGGVCRPDNNQKCA